jgi:hypothetical protein
MQSVKLAHAGEALGIDIEFHGPGSAPAGTGRASSGRGAHGWVIVRLSSTAVVYSPSSCAVTARPT